MLVACYCYHEIIIMMMIIIYCCNFLKILFQASMPCLETIKPIYHDMKKILGTR